MRLTELIQDVRRRGGDPLEAVEMRPAPAEGACAARCGMPCRVLIGGVLVHVKCFLNQLAATASGDVAGPAAHQPGPAPEVPAGPSSAGAPAAAAARSPAAATSRPPVPASRSAARPATAAVRVPTEDRQRLGLAAVLDRGGLWLPGRSDPLPAEPLTDIGGAYRLAIQHSVRQLWIHPNLHESLDLPATRGVTVNPAEAVEDPFTQSDAVRCDPDGLAAWVNVKPAAGEGRRVGIAFPAFETRCAWRRASGGAELLAGVLQLGQQLGENYYFSPNETGVALVRHTASSTPDVLGPADMPAPAGQIVHSHLWARHLLEEEDDSAWIHRYDLNGAEPAVFGAIWIATGPYRHETAPRFERGRDQKRAGYWLLNIDRAAQPLDPRLPDLLRPLREADARGETPGGPAWFCTDSVVLLDELGVTFEVVEAWVAETSQRLLRPTNDRYRAARSGLLEHRRNGLAGAGLAYDVLKSVFTSRIGDFSREGARIYRPDIRDSIIARAGANQYRRLRTIAVGKPSDPNDHGSGRFPLAIYADAVYYLTPEQDAWAGAPAGLPIGDRSEPGVFGDALGEYSHEASLPLSVVREHVGTRNFNGAFQRILDGKSATRPRRTARKGRS